MASGGFAALRRHDGEFLYRYKTTTNLAHLKSIIVDHLLYFSSPNEYRLRDPKDALPNFTVGDPVWLAAWVHKEFQAVDGDLRTGLLGAAWLRSLAADQQASVMVRSFRKDTGQSYRICSFTTRPDSRHHWKEFAADSTGCCFEFESREHIVFGSLARVVEYRPTSPIDICDQAQREGVFVFEKAPGFEVEQEVRAFLVPRGRPNQQPFDPAILRRVILGSTMSPGDRQAIIALCKMRVPNLQVTEQVSELLEKTV